MIPVCGHLKRSYGKDSGKCLLKITQSTEIKQTRGPQEAVDVPSVAIVSQQEVSIRKSFHSLCTDIALLSRKI